MHLKDIISMNDSFLVFHGEDDDIDIRIMKQVLADIDFDGDYKNFKSGQELLDNLLSDTHNTTEDKLPDLLILDIGLPWVDGKEILRALRANEATQYIPVIISSGSSSLKDYHDCVKLGCSTYIQKTTDFEKFKRTCKLFITGWQEVKSQDLF